VAAVAVPECPAWDLTQVVRREQSGARVVARVLAQARIAVAVQAAVWAATVVTQAPATTHRAA
jgi:hypothetical protein